MQVTSKRSILSWALFVLSALLAQAGLVPVHEYYGGGGGYHFYTTSTQEGTNIGYGYNGVAYSAQSAQVAGTVPLYRYGHYLGLFIYTTNYDELGSGAYGYTYHGVQCYVRQEAGEGSVPLYRFMNRTTGNRFYTIAPEHFFGFQYITEENPEYDPNSDWDYDGYDDNGNYQYIYIETGMPNLGDTTFAYEGVSCYVWPQSAKASISVNVNLDSNYAGYTDVNFSVTYDGGTYSGSRSYYSQAGSALFSGALKRMVSNLVSGQFYTSWILTTIYPTSAVVDQYGTVRSGLVVTKQPMVALFNKTSRTWSVTILGTFQGDDITDFGEAWPTANFTQANPDSLHFDVKRYYNQPKVPTWGTRFGFGYYDYMIPVFWATNSYIYNIPSTSQ